MAYSKSRLELAKDLLDGLDDKVVRDGESWARLRNAFSVLLSQYGNAAYTASSYIAGEYVAKDFKGKDARDPITPVDGAQQRQALQFLADEIFADEAFEFPPQILRRLAVVNWSHWGTGSSRLGSSGFGLHDRILGIQRIGLNHCLSADVLRRMQNQVLMFDEDAKPLTMAEIFRTLTDSVWTELSDDTDNSCCSTIRRNLQREHLNRLARIAIGNRRGVSNISFLVFLGGRTGNYPADARSLARMHLKEIRSMVESALEDKSDTKLDDATRAHLEECQDQIAKVLDAELETSQP